MKKIERQFEYFLSSKNFVIIYILLLIGFGTILNTIDKDIFYSESLLYIKIIIVILNIYLFLYIVSAKLYEFSIYFSYQRKFIARVYLRIYLKYFLTSTLYIFFIYNIVAYLKVRYFKVDINLLFSLGLYFLILLLFNANINLIFTGILGVIFTFFSNIAFLFISMMLNNIYIPNFYYDGSYYINMSLKIMALYLIGFIIGYFLIFNFKERR